MATFTAVPENITDPLQTLPVYTNVFSKIGLGDAGRHGGNGADGAVAEPDD